MEAKEFERQLYELFAKTLDELPHVSYPRFLVRSVAGTLIQFAIDDAMEQNYSPSDVPKILEAILEEITDVMTGWCQATFEQEEEAVA